MSNIAYFASPASPASKSRRARARRSRSQFDLDQLDRPRPASPEFAQSALAVLDRVILSVIRQLPIEVGRKLIQAVDGARRYLGTPQVVQLRGWPQDEQVGDVLKKLLARLKELEKLGKLEDPEPPITSSTTSSTTDAGLQESEREPANPQNSDERSKELKKFMDQFVDAVVAAVWRKIQELMQELKESGKDPEILKQRLVN